MAFKTFVNGSVLTDTDLNTMLMKQVVVQCTSGSRPASPPEGMCCYETDTDKLMVYNGSWREFSRGNASQGTATMASGFTASKNYLYARGSFGFMQVTFSRSSTMAALTNHNIGTVPSTYWPAATFDFYGFSNSDDLLTCNVDAGTGQMNARPFAQIAASTPIVLNVVWPLP